MTQEFSVWYPGCPVQPAVARTATLSSTPTTAVAVSGIVYGLWKPATAACGADVAPISSAAQLDQRRPAWHPRAVRTLRAAAASPATISRRQQPADGRTPPSPALPRLAAALPGPMI
jgi:hypothetical protein